MLFDIRQSSPCTAVHSAAGRAVESVHLDSGYYVYLPENIQLEADPVSDPCDGAEEKEDPQVEEGQGDEEIKITVRRARQEALPLFHTLHVRERLRSATGDTFVV